MGKTRKEPNIVEEARQEVISYEEETGIASGELADFKEAHQGQLEAIKAEFEDYKKHPLWDELQKKEAAARLPGEKYEIWYRKRHDDGHLGWQGRVLFGSNITYGSVLPNDPDSILPATLEEFDRRRLIVQNLGMVASMLVEHSDEPIMSVASYPSAMEFAYDKNVKLKSGHDHRNGRVATPKTRITVGGIGQPKATPGLTLELGNAESDSRGGLRLHLVQSIVGAIGNYSFPEDKKELRHQTRLPSYRKHREIRKNKFVQLPIGNSLIGGIPLRELQGRDFMVIDGPHCTAADYNFSQDIVVHRPKQKFEADKRSPGQEILVKASEIARRGVGMATLVSADHEVTLTVPRHDTTWLIGREAIAKYMDETIAEAASSENEQRGTTQAMLATARDLVKLSQEGSPLKTPA